MRVGLMCFRLIELSAIIHADASEVIVWRSPVYVHSAASQVRRVECRGARQWLVLLE